jgi:hypothetical protein
LSLWARWVAFCKRPIDVRPLALTRILASVCIVVDLVKLKVQGLVPWTFQTFENGGLSSIDEPSWVLDDVVGAQAAGPTAYWTSLVCFTLGALGLGTRPALFLGVFAYAQLGHGYPPGDRAIDRILRLVLLTLVFSQAHRRWSLDAWIRARRGEGAPATTTPAGPRDLLLWMLVMVYGCAGVAKVMQQPAWFGGQVWPPLYRITTDPLAAHLDPVLWADHMLPFRVGGVATIVLECSAFLILTKWRKWWAIPGLLMHLGIYATMDLGMFSLGMMALYPLLLGDWVKSPQS